MCFLGNLEDFFEITTRFEQFTGFTGKKDGVEHHAVADDIDIALKHARRY